MYYNIYPDLSFLAQLPIVGNAAELLNILVTLLWNSQTIEDLMARTYLQPHYGNGVFSWTTLRDKHCRHPIAVMGVVDTFGHRWLCAQKIYKLRQIKLYIFPSF